MARTLSFRSYINRSTKCQRKGSPEKECVLIGGIRKETGLKNRILEEISFLERDAVGLVWNWESLKNNKMKTLDDHNNIGR